jgi:hypothetical protein
MFISRGLVLVEESDAMLINATILASAEQLDHLTPLIALLTGIHWVLEWLKNICDAGTPVDPLVKCS